MPSGRSWFNFALINLGFIIQILLMYYWVMAAEIRKNWQKYRCNPMYMPLSNDIQQDFTYCVQNIQSDYIGHLLQPITYLTSSLAELGGSLVTSVNDARTMISKVRTFVSDITDNIYGVFMNLIVEFQKTTLNINDLMKKMVGILVTMVYVLDGSQKTMASMWAGPPGKIVRSLGSCFHPDTQIRLQSGEKVYMKDVELGAILENGSRVDAVMKLNNYRNECFYKLPSLLSDEPDVYATKTHLVKYADDFIPVGSHPSAIRMPDEFSTQWFTCLITNDHQIPISGYHFWDWEDDIITGLPHI